VINRLSCTVKLESIRAQSTSDDYYAFRKYEMRSSAWLRAIFTKLSGLLRNGKYPASSIHGDLLTNVFVKCKQALVLHLRAIHQCPPKCAGKGKMLRHVPSPCEWISLVKIVSMGARPAKPQARRGSHLAKPRPMKERESVSHFTRWPRGFRSQTKTLTKRPVWPCLDSAIGPVRQP